MLMVMKFGGTSVGSADAIRQVVSIVGKARGEGHKVVVVVSAMSGVTDLLLKGAREAESGDDVTAIKCKADIMEKHASVTEELLGRDHFREKVMGEIIGFLDEYEALCHSIRVLGELTPRALDVIGGLGERMNVRQVAAIFEHSGIPSRAIDATDIIVTDDHFGSASPLYEPTAKKSKERIMPLLERDVVPVVTGFIGSTEEGIQTTLGRGGSDFSGTILGRVLEADEVWIWTDVSGVMTADPRIVPGARSIPCLLYAEVGEMAYFGAKVLHPQAIRPARDVGIPVRILNTFEPEHPGTVVGNETSEANGNVKAITAIKSLSLITIEGSGMLGVPGVAARTFGAVARTGTSILMISQSSSEQSICFVIPTKDVPRVVRAVEEEMRLELMRHDIERVWSQDSIVILAVVGGGMKGTPGISSRVFGALGAKGINVIAIAQGSSEYNISLVIAEEDTNEAVRCIHEEFRLGGAGMTKAE